MRTADRAVAYHGGRADVRPAFASLLAAPPMHLAANGFAPAGPKPAKPARRAGDPSAVRPVGRPRCWLEAVLSAEPALGARRTGVASGHAIVEPHHPARSVYLIHRGQVRLYQGGPGGAERLIEILGAGDWFGAASLAGGMGLKSPADGDDAPPFGHDGRHGVRAVAVGPTVVTEVRADDLFAALARRPEATASLVADLAGKLADARRDASALVFTDCHGRLVRTLVRLSVSAAATRTEGGVVLRITHQQLAQAVGVARETVSLALTQLRQRNLLQTGRNQLAFDPRALLRITVESAGE